MPGLNLAPVDFGAVTRPNPLAQIGSALGQVPNELAAATLQNQTVGQQLLAPYLKMLRSDQSLQDNPRFMNAIMTISRRYGIPVPMESVGGETPAAGVGGATSPSTTTTPASAPAGQPPQPAQQPFEQRPHQAMEFAPANVDAGATGAPSVPGVVPGAPATPSEAMDRKLISDKGTPPQQPLMAESSGAPIPGSGTGATPSTPPKMRLSPAFIGATLDAQTALTLQQMQPDQRVAYLQATGVDPRWVPKSLLTSPVVMDPAQKVKVLDSINADITKLQNAGNLSPSRLQELAHSYQASGLIDDATANSLLEDPETLSQMGRGLQVKLDLLLQAGKIKQDQYNLAVQRLGLYASGQSSLADYRKFQEQFIGFRENYMTIAQQQAQSRITLDNQRLSADVTHWDSELEQGQDRLNHSDYATLANDFRSANNNYNSLQATVAQLPAGTDITTPPAAGGESLAQTLSDAKQLRDKLRGQLDAANKGYQNPTPALQKQGVQVKGAGNTVTINGQQYHVGDLVQDQSGKKYKVRADGKLDPQP